MRSYAEVNPQSITQQPLHSNRATIWCGMTEWISLVLSFSMVMLTYSATQICSQCSSFHSWSKNANWRTLASNKMAPCATHQTHHSRHNTALSKQIRVTLHSLCLASTLTQSFSLQFLFMGIFKGASIGTMHEKIAISRRNACTNK